MERTTDLLIEIIRRELKKEDATEEIREKLDTDTLKRILSLSKSHDMAHIVASFLERSGLLPEGEAAEKIKKLKMLAMYRYLGFSRELPAIKEALEDARIPFIVLKGSIIRKFYPEPWMRTSSDIDVLVHEEDVERAREVIEAELDYTTESRNAHEVGMFSPSGVHLELHRTLIEADEFASFENVLSQVWEYTKLEEGSEYSYVMTDDMFYYYHVAHMAKHYMHGGCGIRPFVDMYLLNTDSTEAIEKRKALLTSGGLKSFSEVAEELSGVWLSGASHTSLTKEMADYIIGAGVYGSQENYVTVQQTRRGNKFKYVLSRIWLPYDRLKHYYPSLNGKRILLPFYEFRRWMKLIFSKTTRRRSINEMRASGNLDTARADTLARHMKELGL